MFLFFKLILVIIIVVAILCALSEWDDTDKWGYS